MNLITCTVATKTLKSTLKSKGGVIEIIPYFFIGLNHDLFHIDTLAICIIASIALKSDSISKVGANNNTPLVLGIEISTWLKPWCNTVGEE